MNNQRLSNATAQELSSTTTQELSTVKQEIVDDKKEIEFNEWIKKKRVIKIITVIWLLLWLIVGAYRYYMDKIYKVPVEPPAIVLSGAESSEPQLIQRNAQVIESSLKAIHISIEFITSKTNETVEPVLSQEISVTSSTQQDSIASLLVTYSCDDSLNDCLESYISNVPNELLYCIYQFGYHIELVPNPAKEAGYNKNWCGLTLTDSKTILVQAKENKFRRAVVHEIGHAFDDFLGWVSLSDDFKKVYELEKDSFKVTGFTTDGHYKVNTQEYFAEAFQMYVYDPITLQSFAPLTYDFIKSYISYFSGVC